ncbi:MAG: hypothetical protein QOI54_1448 [Actinomycetota bacterium]|jgi:hypothetical protein|nr:hypothetical protein [Actinomycetota bacterium]
MSASSSSGPRTRGHAGLAARVRTVLGMRGQRSHPARPRPVPPPVARMQQPPFC